MILSYSPNGTIPWRSEIMKAAPPLGPYYGLQRLAGCDLVIEDLDHLLPLRADASPVADQAHGCCHGNWH